MDIVALLVLGPVAGGDAFGGGNPGHAGGRVQTTASGFTYTVSPTLLVDGNVGYTRQNIGANGDEQNGDYGIINRVVYVSFPELIRERLLIGIGVSAYAYYIIWHSYDDDYGSGLVVFSTPGKGGYQI